MAWYHNVKASHGIGIRRKWGNVHLICFIAEQKRWLVFKNAKTIKGLISTFNINWVEQYYRTGIFCSTGMAKPRRHFCTFICGSSENSGWLDYNSVTCNAVWLVQLNRLTVPWQNGKLLIFSQIYVIHLWVSSFKYNLSCFKRAWDTIETIARDWKHSFEKELWTTNRMWGRVVLLLCLVLLPMSSYDSESRISRSVF